MPPRKIRILIVDDSALVREILSKGLSSDPMIEVVGTAVDAYQARDKIVELKPDVVTLDIEMPKMDGITFLTRLLPQYPIPVVVVSSLTQKGKETTLKALEAGAIDFVSKPQTDIARGLSDMLMELKTKIKIASTANVAHHKENKEKLYRQFANNLNLTESTDKVIAIGASTGGTEALRQIITQFPVNSPGIVIVQHMPKHFTKMFADRLNELASIRVKEAESGDRIIAGRALVAPGEKQMKVIRSGGYYQVVCTDGEKVNGHAPSVDVLMHSVAENVGKNAYGIMLTGMGSDGAAGMKAMHDKGAFNIAQDEETSVVYGMPKVAYELGGVDKVLPLNEIVPALLREISKSN